MTTSELILFNTMDFSIVGLDSKASSTIDLKSTVLFPLKTPSDVNIILHSASLILVESATDENPAKTTECTAPILAQANTEMANSGTIGI